jgi:hypothetical protein
LNIYYIFIIFSSCEKIKWIWLKRRISKYDLDNRKISLSYKKPEFVKNQEAVKQIEMLTESIPQLILQIYIFQTKNDIFNVFSSSSIFYESPQMRSITTSTFSIIFGLIGIYGHEAFYFYEPKRILLDKIRHTEKELLPKIGRFISLFFWYFSVVISRILLISLIISKKSYLISLLISFVFIKSFILSKLEKKYFEQKKFMEETEKLSTNFKELYLRPKSLMKSVLSFFNMNFGGYDNVLINIEYHSNTCNIQIYSKYYIIFYFLFYIENIIFAIILYIGTNNNLRIILFYVFTFPIAILIQILYRMVKTKEKASFLVLN